MAVMDTDHDGLPDSDTRLNTYDQWDLRGTPSYISSLSSRPASAIRLARAVGDAEHETAWQAWLARASSNSTRNSGTASTTACGWTARTATNAA